MILFSSVNFMYFMWFFYAEYSSGAQVSKYLFQIHVQQTITVEIRNNFMFWIVWHFDKLLLDWSVYQSLNFHSYSYFSIKFGVKTFV